MQPAGKGDYEETRQRPGAEGNFSQLEDKVMKMAAQFFGEDLLPYIGVKGKIKSVAPTEFIHLEARRLEEDFNYIMKDGTWHHLEFESDCLTEQDLRRFLEYEAYIGLVYGVSVRTTVICTAGTAVLKRELVQPMYTYRVSVVRLKDRDAGRAFAELDRRIAKGKRLKRRHIFPILLTPLMSGEMTVCERICRAVDILRLDQLDMDEEDSRRMQSVLYALAVKFLNKEELKLVKERIGMTILGEMLLQDGMEKGLEKGREQGREQLVAHFLRKDSHVSSAVEMLGVTEEMVLSVAKKEGIAVTR